MKKKYINPFLGSVIQKMPVDQRYLKIFSPRLIGSLNMDDNPIINVGLPESSVDMVTLQYLLGTGYLHKHEISKDSPLKSIKYGNSTISASSPNSILTINTSHGINVSITQKPLKLTIIGTDYNEYATLNDLKNLEQLSQATFTAVTQQQETINSLKQNLKNLNSNIIFIQNSSAQLHYLENTTDAHSLLNEQLNIITTNLDVTSSELTNCISQTPIISQKISLSANTLNKLQNSTKTLSSQTNLLSQSLATPKDEYSMLYSNIFSLTASTQNLQQTIEFNTNTLTKASTLYNNFQPTSTFISIKTPEIASSLTSLENSLVTPQALIKSCSSNVLYTFNKATASSLSSQNLYNQTAKILTLWFLDYASNNLSFNNIFKEQILSVPLNILAAPITYTTIIENSNFIPAQTIHDTISFFSDSILLTPSTIIKVATISQTISNKNNSNQGSIDPDPRISTQPTLPDLSSTNTIVSSSSVSSTTKKIAFSWCSSSLSLLPSGSISNPAISFSSNQNASIFLTNNLELFLSCNNSIVLNCNSFSIDHSFSENSYNVNFVGSSCRIKNTLIATNQTTLVNKQYVDNLIKVFSLSLSNISYDKNVFAPFIGYLKRINKKVFLRFTAQTITNNNILPSSPVLLFNFMDNFFAPKYDVQFPILYTLNNSQYCIGKLSINQYDTKCYFHRCSGNPSTSIIKILACSQYSSI